MSAKILEGHPVAAKIREELAPALESFRKEEGIAPTLAIVRVGNPPAAVSYARSVDRAFVENGMGFQLHVLGPETGESELIALLNELSRADDVHGVMLQRPLPPGINPCAVMSAFPPAKDVEGVTVSNIGNLALDTGNYFPTSTPSAAIEILSFYAIPVEGRRAVVVGRSNILGKPMALLLLRANATVVVCHSHTRDLAEWTRQADLLIGAVGHPQLITAGMVARGATVIDFGVNVRGEQLVGDVDFDAVKEIASAITPVPGGAGPVTTMMLMRNTIRAAQKQADKGKVAHAVRS